MHRRVLWAFLGGALGLLLWLGADNKARAQGAPQPQPNYYLGKWYYYPHYYFPHNYWPSQGPKWPETPGQPYMKPPAYMAYPPFLEPHWRYELWEPQRYYRGTHFWLDQF